MENKQKPAKKNIIAIFRYAYPLVGLKDILQRLDALNDLYDLTIITNDARALPEKYKKVIVFRKEKNLWVFLARVRLKLLSLKYDGIFLAGIHYTPIKNLFIRKPTICYGNVNPLQICGIKDEQELRQSRNTFKRMRQLLRLKIFYKSLKKCDKILAISETLREEFIKKGIQKEKIELIYMGTDTELFKPVKKKNKSFTAIYPGTITEERGLSIILKGLADLSKHNIKVDFKFIGCTRQNKNHIMSAIQKLNIKSKVTCLPVLPIESVARQIAEAHVGVSILEDNAYFRTSPPTKMFEYMSSGIAIVANDIKTHTDYLQNRRDCIIIHNTPKDFSKAISSLYKDRKLLKQISAKALQESSKYSWPEQKVKFINVFEKLLK